MKTASIITEKIIAALTKGTVPWQRPFLHGSPKRSCGKEYRGINSLLLNFVQSEAGYTSPYWITYNEATKLGATVRPGEKSTIVVFWKKLIFNDNSSIEDTDTDDNINDETSTQRPRFMLRFYRVFNACQCDGLPLRFHPGHSTPILEIGKYQRADAIISGYPNAPLIREAMTTPHYSPTTDIVCTPPMSQAVSPEAYYSTMFHELAHSTGHEKRLNRPLKNEFGSKEYAREELIAEMAACFLCAEAGIEPMIENSASYINSWLGALQKDHNLVVVAAGKAQHAADHILDRKPQTATTPAESQSSATAGA